VDIRAAGFSGSHHTETVSRGVELYGPGDVLVFNSSAVVKTDPLNMVGDFERNYFPFVEFADPDFLWRYTAAKEDSNGNLKPWITLVVLLAENLTDGGSEKEFQDGARIDKDLPPSIIVDSPVLPDLDEAWRWAHVQVTADAGLDVSSLELNKELRRIVAAEPERAVSRLVCARKPRPGALYNAFVVPAFKPGRYAGCGIVPSASE